MTTAAIVRPADFERRGERNWIIKSWIACDRASPSARRAGPGYLRSKGASLEALLSAASTRVLVAHLPENSSDDLAGFVCFDLEPAQLHYVYVRKAAQHIGVGVALVRAAGLFALPAVVTTHQPIGDAAKLTLPPGWTYRPLDKKERPCASAT